MDSIDDIEVIREVMKDLEKIQDDPCVGPFWYDPNENELFGVSSSISTGLLFKPNAHLKSNVRTNGMAHLRIWAMESHRGEDPRFKGNYESSLRGYVVEIEGGGYRVYTGDWIEEFPSAKRMILDEYQLPEDATEFVKDASLVDHIE